MAREIKLPNIGDFDAVEIIEVLVSAGDTVAKDDSLITLESDKATMDVPAPFAGTLSEVKVKVGEKVSEGDVIAVAEETSESQPDAESESDAGSDGESRSESEDKKEEPAESDSEDTEETDAAEDETSAQTEPSGTDAEQEQDMASPQPDDEAFEKASGEADTSCDVLVLGAGPGGYTAAFRAADLGRDVALIEARERLGGVCLNVGCIPSKALLHAAEVIEQAHAMQANGVSFGKPKINLDGVRTFEQNAVKKLTSGLAQMAKQRKVNVVHGYGRFTGSHLLEVGEGKKKQTIAFRQAIIAAGSEPSRLPEQPDDPRIMDSTDALELADIPKKLLVVGGGIIGLEMAQVYAALGSAVTVVELTDGLMPGTDRDLVRVYQKQVKDVFEAVHLKTGVKELKAQKNGIHARCEGPDGGWGGIFDRVLVAVGRSANGKDIGADAAGVSVDDRGLVSVDSQMRTNVDHIFAIGDIVGQPMLAHKASHEGKVAAEAACGERSHFDVRAIPSVAYTHPEVAWAGVTETEAKEKGIGLDKAVFPWQANGRALTLGVDGGMTKLLFDKDNGRIVGAGIVGPNAGELIAELVLAIEMGCDAEDIALSIHPHPTLSESVGMAAEVAAGTITDLYLPNKR
ncbi:MAG: dihydrolipoyl dehydrogenase [Gammaproteobacteria bacterium]